MLPHASLRLAPKDCMRSYKYFLCLALVTTGLAAPAACTDQTVDRPERLVRDAATESPPIPTGDSELKPNASIAATECARAPLTAPASGGTCSVTKRGTAGRVFQGTVLLPDETLQPRRGLHQRRRPHRVQRVRLFQRAGIRGGVGRGLRGRRDFARSHQSARVTSRTPTNPPIRSWHGALRASQRLAQRAPRSHADRHQERRE